MESVLLSSNRPIRQAGGKNDENYKKAIAKATFNPIAEFKNSDPATTPKGDPTFKPRLVRKDNRGNVYIVGRMERMFVLKSASAANPFTLRKVRPTPGFSKGGKDIIEFFKAGAHWFFFDREQKIHIFKDDTPVAELHIKHKGLLAEDTSRFVETHNGWIFFITDQDTLVKGEIKKIIADPSGYKFEELAEDVNSFLLTPDGNLGPVLHFGNKLNLKGELKHTLTGSEDTTRMASIDGQYLISTVDNYKRVLTLYDKELKQLDTVQFHADKWKEESFHHIHLIKTAVVSKISVAIIGFCDIEIAAVSVRKGKISILSEPTVIYDKTSLLSIEVTDNGYVYVNLYATDIEADKSTVNPIKLFKLTFPSK